MRSQRIRQEREAVYAGSRSWPVRVEWRESADQVDDTGFPIDAWEDEALSEPEWMTRRDVSAQERLAADQMTASLVTVWTMAYRPDMDPDLVDVAKLRRLVFGERIFDITGAAVIGSYEGIELATLAKVG